MNNLQELFEETVRLTYNADKRFIKAMPKLYRAASDEKLKSVIKDQMEQTQRHIRTMEKIAKDVGFRSRGKVCKTAKCLVEENDVQLSGEKPGDTLDAAIIVCSQRVEHYGICAYGTLVAWAIELGNTMITEQLEEILKNHADADEKYSKIARRINSSANSLVALVRIQPNDFDRTVVLGA